MSNGPQDEGVAAAKSALPEAPAAPTSPDFSKISAFVLWSKYEDVAMHFNDLIMKLRTQALAGLAGVVTVAGLAVGFTGKTVTATEWEVLFGTNVFLLLAWVALCTLDLGYYNRLLRGAVKAIEAHEALTQAAEPIERIILSTRISASAKHHVRYIVGFYGIVFLGLLAGIGVTIHKWSLMTATPSSSNKFESKSVRGSAEGVDLRIAPADTAPSGVPKPSRAEAAPMEKPFPPAVKAKGTP
jgi:hypothetical protein